MLFIERLGVNRLKFIDEDGNLFGYVNLIDAIVLLIVVALLVGGLALVLSEDSADSSVISNSTNYTNSSNRDLIEETPGTIDRETRELVLLAEEQPDYIGSALTTGPVDDSDITTVKDISVQDMGENNTILVLVEVISEVKEDGSTRWRGDALVVGRTVRVDLRGVRFEGVIVEVGGDIVLTPVDSGN